MSESRDVDTPRKKLRNNNSFYRGWMMDGWSLYQTNEIQQATIHTYIYIQNTRVFGNNHVVTSDTSRKVLRIETNVLT